MTEYVVFTMNEGKWEECSRPSARSANSAIRHYLGSTADQENGEQYAAVPARSWKPVTVKVETKTQLKFS